MFFNTAYAQTAGGGGATGGGGGEAGLFGSFLPLILIIVLFYFLLIRPQQKRNKEHRKMLDALAAGDEVITSGGIMGRVDAVRDNYVTLDVGERAGETKVRFQKNHIQAILPKGTLGS